MPRTREALVLDDQLCFALYAASRAMTARYRPHLDAIGLTYPQFLVMIVLWDDGPTTVSGLGEQLRLDSGTLSPLLKRLEANKLIRRTRNTNDERSVIVTPTARGKRLRDQAAGVVGEIRTSLVDIDLAGLMDGLHDLERALREGSDLQL